MIAATKRAPVSPPPLGHLRLMLSERGRRCAPNGRARIRGARGIARPDSGLSLAAPTDGEAAGRPGTRARRLGAIARMPQSDPCRTADCHRCEHSRNNALRSTMARRVCATFAARAPSDAEALRRPESPSESRAKPPVGEPGLGAKALRLADARGGGECLNPGSL